VSGVAVEPDVVVAALRAASVGRGDLVGLAVMPGVGVGLAAPELAAPVALAVEDPAAVVAMVEDELRPRWVIWSGATAARLVEAGVRLATAWDVAAVHRLLFGGWKAEPDRVWAALHDLDPGAVPTLPPLDLFSQPAHDDAAALVRPVRPDGYLEPRWVLGAAEDDPQRLARWAALALEAAALQERRLTALPAPDRARRAVRSESTAELLCAELSADGLPVDRDEAEAVIAGFVGPRPRTALEAAEQRAERDAAVLRLAPPGQQGVDLRSLPQVKSLLRRAGVEVPDTRKWRLEAMRDSHPLVAALLDWRKAERISTTFGYAWLDERLGVDGRLRGEWTGSDGAAGRMTASAGLHNMPAALRRAVVAEPGHVFVRADLGQIEPRVLAAVSGDRALAEATQEDDLYAPVAAQLGVDRATAKVAVLGAMYGQTTGHGAQALRGLQAAYPVAMAHLDEADRTAQGGWDVRTYGGRLVRMGFGPAGELTASQARARAAARGRYGRNAVIQGAAAELFKVWAVTVRARAAPLDARIVLCLHDELLVHVPTAHGDAVSSLLDDCLQESAARWAPDRSVRFLAETSVIGRWSDAKG